MPAAISAGQQAADREALLDAVESLVYTHGVQAVGMDQIRAESGLALKRIYAMFRTKEDLVVAMLQRRDRRWRGSLAAFVAGAPEPVPGLFEWLRNWFAEPGFRGCAWINIHGEFAPGSPAVLAEVRAHKDAFRAQIQQWAPGHAEAIYLLAEGAIVTAGITGDPATADRAAAAAAHLLRS
ncbi:TetR/AcrR family transcriptional regulator [Pseudonocardiaceae bacterium YIM PH 21723]|nr:TetR/AcrR family transcriptional regulator [Pseudonocardiaceae bacterium YIM PH 21723]